MKTVCKWVLFFALILAGFAAFLFIVGDENAQHPLTFAELVGVKVGALASLFLIFRAALAAYKNGLLPELKQYIDVEE